MFVVLTQNGLKPHIYGLNAIWVKNPYIELRNNGKNLPPSVDRKKTSPLIERFLEDLCAQLFSKLETLKNVRISSYRP